MTPEKSSLESLIDALDTYFTEYEARRQMYTGCPKFPIEKIFEVWNQLFAAFDVEQPQNALSFLKENRLKLRSAVGDFLYGYLHFNRELFDEQYSTKADIATLADAAFHNSQLNDFFGHDIGHLQYDLKSMFWIPSGDHGDISFNTMRQFSGEIQNFLEQFNETPDFFLSPTLEPYKMLHFMATHALGRKPLKELFSPPRLAWQIAHILQYRDAGSQWGVVSHGISDAPTQRNELILDCEDFLVSGNSGVVFSIIYNLAKNAYKKLSGSPHQGHKIYLQLYEAPPGCYVITVADNGKPIDITKMKEMIRREISERGIENMDFLTHETKKRFRDWEKSPYRVGELSAKNLTEIAFMSRMSGFETPHLLSSGMGLYGVQALIENMGGRILYGEEFSTGSPIFTCILPKQFADNSVQKFLSQTSAQIHATGYYYFGNPKKAA